MNSFVVAKAALRQLLFDIFYLRQVQRQYLVACSFFGVLSTLGLLPLDGTQRDHVITSVAAVSLNRVCFD